MPKKNVKTAKKKAATKPTYTCFQCHKELPEGSTGYALCSDKCRRDWEAYRESLAGGRPRCLGCGDGFALDGLDGYCTYICRDRALGIKRICTWPGCEKEMAPGSGLCAAHQREVHGVSSGRGHTHGR